MLEEQRVGVAQALAVLKLCVAEDAAEPGRLGPEWGVRREMGGEGEVRGGREAGVMREEGSGVGEGGVSRRKEGGGERCGRGRSEQKKRGRRGAVWERQE